MSRSLNPPNFRRAVIVSFTVHVVFFLLLLTNPSLPRSSKRGMVHYLPLNMVSFSGGGGGGGMGGPGGGGGGPAKKAAQVPAKKETLRDLTIPQKLKVEEPKSSLRFPTDKPKRDAKQSPDKKAVISKPEPKSAAETLEKEAAGGTEEGGGAGSGLRIGVGGGPGGGSGFGSGYGDQIGFSGFPYTWYLQLLSDKISAQWFTSLIDPGVSGQFQVVVTFKVQKNGQVTDVVIDQPSGVPSLDDSAKRAVQRAAPFAPLPSDYKDQYLVIHLIFEHSK